LLFRDKEGSPSKEFRTRRKARGRQATIGEVLSDDLPTEPSTSPERLEVFIKRNAPAESLMQTWGPRLKTWPEGRRATGLAAM
jgi:hypothetical protein